MTLEQIGVIAAIVGAVATVIGVIVALRSKPTNSTKQKISFLGSGNNINQVNNTKADRKADRK